MKSKLVGYLCFLNYYAVCVKWKRVGQEFDVEMDPRYGNTWQESADEMLTKLYQKQEAADHFRLIPMARYVLHNADLASLATISTLPEIDGYPFANMKSVVDGTFGNSTGVPYFYMSASDFSARDLAKNNLATVLVSLEDTRYCENHKIDPEDPRCNRLMLSGKIKKLDDGSPEFQFAKSAFFERHPAFSTAPAGKDWFIAKLKIGLIAMVDWYGNAKYIPVGNYLSYHYTGTEILQYYFQHVQRTVIS